MPEDNTGAPINRISVQAFIQSTEILLEGSCTSVGKAEISTGPTVFGLVENV